MLERVVIAGRPNVGKSALFNRIISSRRALVCDISGTTVDYIESEVEWEGKRFILADTGGWMPTPPDPVHKKMRDISSRLSSSASAVIFVVDSKTGLTSGDEAFGAYLRKFDRKVIVAANKSDTDERANAASEFWRLGLGEPIPVSAVTGRNVDTLLDAAARLISADENLAPARPEKSVPKIIILGRPNAGKSTLLNRLAGMERTVTDPRPGTTRESVDIIIERNGRRLLFADTPGIARKRKFEETLEYLSYVSMNKFVEKSDVAVLLVDALEGITKADEALAGLVAESSKACVVAFNKWDAASGREELFKRLADEFIRKYNFLAYARFTSISGATGMRVDSLVEEILAAYEAYNFVLDARALDEILRDAILRQPALRGAKKLSVRKIISVSSAPPTVVMLLNDPSLVNFSYKRFLANRIRDKYPLKGSPLRLVFKRETRK